MSNKKSLFITIEGIEGSGKSTNAKVVVEYLQSLNFNVVHTREPGGTLVAEKIRSILLEPTAEKFTKETELLLLFAARSQHIQHLILPALHAGKIVVCERFIDATFAYQGGGRGVDFKYINFLADFIQHNLRPDLVFIFDVDVKLGLERVKLRGNKVDRIEQEKIDFFVKVKNTYLEIANKDPERYCIINTAQPINAIQEQLILKLDQFLYVKQLLEST